MAQLGLLPFTKEAKVSTKTPIITISREMGAGGRPVATLLAKKLGRPWKIYHKDMIERISKEAKLQDNLIKEIDESQRSTIEEIIYDLFGRKYVTLSIYYKHLVKIITMIGKRGHAIIIGRGANFLIPNALKIRIIADREQRIEWEMKFEKISRREAVRRIANSYKKRKAFIKSLFGKDIEDPHHYDLVIRTSKDLSVRRAAEIIYQEAKRKFRI